MAEKLFQYQGIVGYIHGVIDNLRERWNSWRDDNSSFGSPETVAHEDFSHIYRRKTRKELVRVSAAVMGIEFSYAAETAFVSPTLLKIGVEHKHMTLVWALSPLIGFFVTPILGSVSDRCHLSYGRRRPFIVIMSVGVLLAMELSTEYRQLGQSGIMCRRFGYYFAAFFKTMHTYPIKLNRENHISSELGLIMVPNGEILGYAFGDDKPPNIIEERTFTHRITSHPIDNNTTEEFLNTQNNTSHPWGIFFTVLGTVLLDFDADGCQSPARAYLLDVTLPEDHARGLSTFTILAGLGGFFGYALGGINWDVTLIGTLLGGHVRAVFTLITVIFIICVTFTVTSFKEMPLRLLELQGNDENFVNYGSLKTDEEEENGFTNEPRKSIVPSPDASFLIYLKSIIYMPYSIKMLCLTNLFCWMAHVCYSLYFTDFVGEAVFNGNPTALEGDPSRELYESGVRFGCWGMSMYSLSCACYSSIIERLIRIYGARNVYTGGLLSYSIGMLLMALTKHMIGVILFSWTAGVMYSTLFTMPYLLVAHYHAKGTFDLKSGDENSQIRGLGTDVALVSSMVFLAQFILSLGMGWIVNATGTTTAVVAAASFLALCGAISSTKVMYLDL